MKVVLDNIIFSLQSSGGVSSYWSELINHYLTKRDFHNFLLFQNKSVNIYPTVVYALNKDTFLPTIALRYIPFLKKLPAPCIFHSSYYRFSLRKKVINIVTVHDFTYEIKKNGILRYIHIWQKKFAIKNADGIICVSENTRKDLFKFYPKIKKDIVKVIHNGVSAKFHPTTEPNKEVNKKIIDASNDRPFFLFVGSRASYKNFHIAIQILEKLHQKYNLIIVGGGKLNYNEQNSLKEYKSYVYHFEDISSKDLCWLYNKAFAFLYPSSYEGFGIPVVEAMKAGCPVISTKTSSIEEISSNAAILVDNIAIEDFLNAINKLENDDFRQLLISKGLTHSKNFSWEKCAEETYSFYQEIYEKNIEKIN